MSFFSDNNKHIGIDIDDVLADTARVVFAHAQTIRPYLSSFSYDSISHHDWWNIPEFHLSRDEAIQCWQSFGSVNPEDAAIPLFPDSTDAITTLRAAGYTLYAVTGRSKKTREASTRAWIDRHFPGVFEDIIFTGYLEAGRANKSETCKIFDIGLMIEDNLDFALELAENGIATYVLERPWNRDRPEQSPYIHRVKDWNEILSDLQK